MTPFEKRHWLLGRAPQFSGVDAELLRGLAEETELIEVKARQHVYLEGDRSDRVFLVHGGRLKTYRVEGGHSVTLGLHSAGGSFGELALSDEVARAESAVALKMSQLTVIPHVALVELVHTSAALAARLVVLLAAQRRVLEDRLVSLVAHKADVRVAGLLLKLLEREGSRVAGFPHTELAELVGVRRETISAVLGELEQQGLVYREGRRIVVKDLPRLHALAQGLTGSEAAHG